jgi:hypothetical protein
LVWLAEVKVVALLDILRTGVKIADAQTKSVQCDVQLRRFTKGSGTGVKDYGSPITLKAIVDWKQKQVRTMSGVLSISRATVLFLDITALRAATNGEGIDDDDEITLPDGTTGPILDMGGFVDAGTKIPLATTVFLG